MNRTLTLSVRSLLVVLLVAMALVTAYLLGGSGSSASAADDGGGRATAPDRRLLTMTGTGSATAVPDQLSFSLGVALKRTALDDALDAANHTMSRVLTALTRYGVERSDVQTTGLSMTPVYEYHSYAPPTLTGYRVSERASVLVHDLAKGGGAVSAAVATGGNDVRVGDIRLLVGDTDAVMKRARDAAVAEARAKAEQYAAASGQTLGEVQTLQEVRTRPLPTVRQTRMLYGHAAAANGVALSALPIRAGHDRASVAVRVVWALQ